MILTPTQRDLDLFAALSGDANPIHVDPDFAARSGFGRTVAHGAMLTSWLIRAAGLPRAPSTSSAMFPAPAFAEEALQAVREGEAWQLVRLQDRQVVCHLMLDAPMQSETQESVGKAVCLPLQIGMIFEQVATPQADALRALQDLQGRAGHAELEPALATELAGQAYMLGLISTLLGMHLPGQGTNYLKQETNWYGCLTPGEAINVRVCITRLRPEKALVDLATQIVTGRGEALARGRALVSARDVANAF